VDYPGLRVVSLAQIMREDDRLWASVSYCAGSDWFIKTYGPKPITRYVYATREEAYKSKAHIDQMGCGGGCEEWHVVEVALPREHAKKHYTVTRRAYRAYGATIPEIFLLPSDRKRLAREQREPKDAPKYRFSILKRDGYRCRICGAAASDGPHVKLNVDHIIPKINGGTDDPDNLWTLCWQCNIGKGTQEL
jgi:hypothetical protein